MARTIKGGQVKSVKQLKNQMKKGGGEFFTRIPADGAITVRYIEEPDRWVTFYEHYDAVRNFYPCSDECPGCDEGDSPSQRYLANALDVDESKVIPLLMAKTLAQSVLKRYDKYGTLLDRDYELSREGEGFDTTYDALPEPPTKINVNRYEPLDLWALVEDQLPSDDEDDEDEEEEERPRRKTKKATAKKTAKRPPRKTTIADDDEEDDDYDDDTEDDEPPVRRTRKPAPKKRTAPSASSRTPSRRTPPQKRTVPQRTVAKKTPARRTMQRG